MDAECTFQPDTSATRYSHLSSRRTLDPDNKENRCTQLAKQARVQRDLSVEKARQHSQRAMYDQTSGQPLFRP